MRQSNDGGKAGGMRCAETPQAPVLAQRQHIKRWINGPTERGTSVQRRGCSTVGASPRPISRRHVTGNAKFLTALWTLLCFSALLAASGPHLVHHLLDRHRGHTHSHAHKSQPTDCLVRALVQHTPVTQDASVLPTVVLPKGEGAGGEPFFQKLTAPRPTCQARSPPALPHS
jgi:hypothetical protein